MAMPFDQNTSYPPPPPIETNSIVPTGINTGFNPYVQTQSGVHGIAPPQMQTYFGQPVGPMFQPSAQTLTAQQTGMMSPFYNAGSMLGGALYAPPAPQPTFNNSAAFQPTGGITTSLMNSMFGAPPAYMTSNEYRTRHLNSAIDQAANMYTFASTPINMAYSQMSGQPYSDVTSQLLFGSSKGGGVLGQMFQGTMGFGAGGLLPAAANFAGGIMGRYGEDIAPIAKTMYNAYISGNAMERYASKKGVEYQLQADSFRWYGGNHGRGVTREQSREMASSIQDIASENMSAMGDFGVKDILENMQTLKFNNYMYGTSNIKDFKDRMKNLIETAKEVAVAMNQTVSQAMETVEDLKRLGYKDKASMVNAIKDVSATGNLTGRTGAEVLNIATQAGTGLAGTGITRSAAVGGSAEMMVAMDIAQKHGQVSPGILNAIGGRDNAAAVLSATQLRYFSQDPRSVTAFQAAFNPATGEIDRNKLEKIMSGNTAQEVVSGMALANTVNPTANMVFMNKRASFMEDNADLANQAVLMTIRQDATRISRSMNVNMDTANTAATRNFLKQQGLSEDYATPFLSSLENMETAKALKETESFYVQSRIDEKRKDDTSSMRGWWNRRTEMDTRRRQREIERANMDPREALSAFVRDDIYGSVTGESYYSAPKFMQSPEEITDVMKYTASQRGAGGDWRASGGGDLTFGMVQEARYAHGNSTGRDLMAYMAKNSALLSSQAEFMGGDDPRAAGMMRIDLSRTEQAASMGKRLGRMNEHMSRTVESGLSGYLAAQVEKFKEKKVDDPGGKALDAILEGMEEQTGKMSDAEKTAMRFAFSQSGYDASTGELKEGFLGNLSKFMQLGAGDGSGRYLSRQAIENYERKEITPYLSEMSSNQMKTANQRYAGVQTTETDTILAGMRDRFRNVNDPNNQNNLAAAFAHVESTVADAGLRDTIKQKFAADVDLGGLEKAGMLMRPEGGGTTMTIKGATELVNKTDKAISEAGDSEVMASLSPAHRRSLKAALKEYKEGTRSRDEISSSLTGDIRSSFATLTAADGMDEATMKRYRAAKYSLTSQEFEESVLPYFDTATERLKTKGGSLTGGLKSALGSYYASDMTNVYSRIGSVTSALGSSYSQIKASLKGIAGVDARMYEALSPLAGVMEKTQGMGSRGLDQATAEKYLSDSGITGDDAKTLTSQIYGSQSSMSSGRFINALRQSSKFKEMVVDKMVSPLMTEKSEEKEKQADKEFSEALAGVFKQAADAFFKTAQVNEKILHAAEKGK